MSNWTSAVIKANGIDIHILRTGGDKPPVVLLHGLAGSGTTWTLVARALEADFDVIMPDARGHGQSSAPETGYRYEELAADVVGLIQALGLDAPVLLGHSMGGLTAAVVAAQQAVRLRGLILADPTFLSPDRQREVYESDAAEQHRRLLGQDKADALAQALARQPHRSPELLGLIIDARLNTPVRSWDVLTPPNPDYLDLVRAIDVPTLLITAERGVVTADMAQALTTLNPHLQVEPIANAGHGLHFDQPERFAAVVRAFLRSLPEG